MGCERASTLGLLAGLLASAAARPGARSQRIRRQNAQDCLEELGDVLDDAPTVPLWPATACDFTSTLSGAELTSTYASFRSRMASWYSEELGDITRIESSCTQYAPVFDRIRYCYVTGPFPTPIASTTTATTVATAATTSGEIPTARRTSASATTTPTSSGTTATATPNPGGGGGGGLDPGAKAGLAIGIVLAVILALFICWKFFQRYRSTRLAEASGHTKGDVEPQMQSAAAAIGGAAAGATGAGTAAGAARTKLRPPESSVYAYKSELSGESRPISELDPAAVAEAPRPHGPPVNVAELEPDPPAQLSELPADNYDPTTDGSPPPAYVYPMNDINRNTLDTPVSPLSPDSSTMRTQALGNSPGGTTSEGASSGSGSAPLVSESQSETVQHGWGRGWMRRG